MCVINIFTVLNRSLCTAFSRDLLNGILASSFVGQQGGGVSVHPTRNVVLRQGKKAFYEGNVLLWYLTGIKSLFDAGRGQKPEWEHALAWV